MISLILVNVERLVDSEEKAVRLEEQGYRRIEGKAEAAAGENPAVAFDISENDTGRPELSDLSVSDLRKIAKTNGVKGAGSLTKEELIEALEEALEE